MNANSLFFLPSYNVVLINLVLGLVLVAGVLVYRYVFPKKPLNWGILVILFSVLPIISIFRKGDYGGYLYQNIEYAAGFWNSLVEGHIFPAWAANMDSPFGYPAFIFLYPFPYYLTSLFHFLGFNFTYSVKMVFILAYLAAGLGMWLWARTKFPSIIAFLVAILYQFAPYRFVVTSVELELGESVALALLPFVFLFIDKSWILGGIFTATLIISHPAAAIGGVVLVLLYFHKKALKPILLGLGLSAYYWLPILLELGYVHNANEFLSTPVIFVRFGDLIYPLLGGFSSDGSVSHFIGCGAVLVILSSFIVLIKRKYNKEFLFWLAASLIIIALMLQMSQPIWQVIPFMKDFQNSWRLLSILAFTISILGGTILTIIKKKYWPFIVFGLMAVTIFSTVQIWGNRENSLQLMPDDYIQKVLPLMSQSWWDLGFFPALPKWVSWTDMREHTEVDAPMDVVSGNAKITQISRTSVKHTYLLDVAESSLLRENTNYFPGWVLKVDGVYYPINYKNTDFSGTMEFRLDRGVYNVEFDFIDTPDRSVAKIISGVTVFFVLILFTKKFLRLRIFH